MKVAGSFTINGGATREVEMEDGLTLEQIADRMYEQAPGVSLCHQCGGELDDPELGDLTQLTVDGKVYVPDEASGGWAEWKP